MTNNKVTDGTRIVMQESTKKRTKLYPIIDRIQKENPMISMRDLVLQVQKETNQGCKQTIQTRYMANRRQM